jgi:hypothetical protein
VVTGCGDRNCTTTGSVIVLLGNGHGRFTRAGQFVAGPSGTTADTMASGDFNRDGTPDLVVVNSAIKQFGTISILLADGTGGFLPPVSYSVVGPCRFGRQWRISMEIVIRILPSRSRQRIPGVPVPVYLT